MAIANVELTNTFNVWRTRTNDAIVLLNSISPSSNIISVSDFTAEAATVNGILTNNGTTILAGSTNVQGPIFNTGALTALNSSNTDIYNHLLVVANTEFVTGNVNVHGTLLTTSNTVLSGTNTHISSVLYVDGIASFIANTSIRGNFTTNGSNTDIKSGSTIITGNTTIYGTNTTISTGGGFLKIAGANTDINSGLLNITSTSRLFNAASFYSDVSIYGTNTHIASATTKVLGNTNFIGTDNRVAGKFTMEGANTDVLSGTLYNTANNYVSGKLYQSGSAFFTGANTNLSSSRVWISGAHTTLAGANVNIYGTLDVKESPFLGNIGITRLRQANTDIRGNTLYVTSNTVNKGDHFVSGSNTTVTSGTLYVTANTIIKGNKYQQGSAFFSGANTSVNSTLHAFQESRMAGSNTNVTGGTLYVTSNTIIKGTTTLAAATATSLSVSGVSITGEAWREVEKSTPSGVTSVELAHVMVAGYEYALLGLGISSTTGAAWYPYVRFRNDGGTLLTGASDYYIGAQTTGVAGLQSNASLILPYNWSGFTGIADASASFDWFMTIQRPLDTAVRTRGLMDSMIYVGNSTARSYGSYIVTTIDGHTRITVALSGGTFDAGDLYLLRRPLT